MTAVAVPAAVADRYTLAAIWLHWVVAVLIFANAALVLSAQYWPDDWVRPIIDTHKSIGITVLGLIVLRILWRLGHPPPPLPVAYRAWERAASHVAHALLYLLILALTLTGWMHDSAWKEAASHPIKLFGLVSFPRIAVIQNLEPGFREHMHDVFGAAHKACAWALFALVAVHVGAALKHEWIDGQRELARMWPRSKSEA